MDDWHCSELRQVRIGVPQGSILGPNLFSIFTADAHEVPKSATLHAFADDMQLYIPLNVLNAAAQVAKLNRDLQGLWSWARDSGHRFNPGKCSFLLLGSPHGVQQVEELDIRVVLGGDILCPSTNHRNLGLVMDEHLQFTKHIDRLIQSAYYRLRHLFQFRDCLPHHVRKLLVETLVLSLFNYSDYVYGPCLTVAQKYRVQKVQNWCVRFVLDVPPFHHITPFLRSLGWLKMQERRFVHYAALVVKIVSKQRPNYLFNCISFRNDVHDRPLRGIVQVTVPQHRTSSFEGSFSYLSAYIYNYLHRNNLTAQMVPTLRRTLERNLLGGTLNLDIRYF